MTEETTDQPGTMIMRCSRCHSTDVRRDGIACWNPSRQQWELIDVLDDAWCEGCGAAGRRLIEEHAANGQQPPGTPPIESIVTAMEPAAQLQAADAAKESPRAVDVARQLAGAATRTDPEPERERRPLDVCCANEWCQNQATLYVIRDGAPVWLCADCYHNEF